MACEECVLVVPEQQGKPYHRDNAAGGRRPALRERGERGGGTRAHLQAPGTGGDGVHESPLP